MSNEQDKPIAFELRAYTKKELRLLYKIPESTFRRWLKLVPEAAASGRRNWLDIVQVEAILKVRGVPGEREFK